MFGSLGEAQQSLMMHGQGSNYATNFSSDLLSININILQKKFETVKIKYKASAGNLKCFPCILFFFCFLFFCFFCF